MISGKGSGHKQKCVAPEGAHHDVMTFSTADAVENGRLQGFAPRVLIASATKLATRPIVPDTSSDRSQDKDATHEGR